jgi:hypothetical protein
VKQNKGGFGFFYLVPRHLAASGGVLDLGGVLALADEISTVLLCCEDKTHRAGVSVSLSGEILRPEELKAGNTVWVESVISKVGAALGFAEVRVMGHCSQSALNRTCKDYSKALTYFPLLILCAYRC